MRTLLSQSKAAAAGAAIAIALYFSGLFTLLAPIPVLYVYVTRGRAAGLTSALASGLIVVLSYIFLMPAAASGDGLLAYVLMPGQGLDVYLPSDVIAVGGIGYFAFYLAIAIALGEGSLRRWELLKWGGAAFVAGIAVIAIVAAASIHLGAAGVIEGLRSYLAAVVGGVARMREQGGEAGAQMAFLADRAPDAAAFFVRMMPGIAVLFTSLTVAINIIVCRRVIKGSHAFSHVHNVARFRVPDLLIWGVIVSGAAFFLDSYALHSGVARDVALNVLIALGAIYFLQGMAVIIYFVQGIKAPLLRGLAYVAMVLFLQTVSLGLLAVGIADVWANFRLRRWRAIHHHS
ncbi:MAG: DUF2232 domain-containing protein [Proteobacteria bacterium]|nr:DUF2232 domain-containing protein [Pseudomonadota bacterium]